MVCPSCGAAQYEPRHLVYTFCKRCGVHLSIVKKRVIASEVSKSGGQRSAMEPTKVPTPPVAGSAIGVVPGPRPSSGPMRTLRPIGPPAQAPVVSKATSTSLFPDISDTGELGLGMMMQAAVSTGFQPLPESAAAPQPAPVPVVAEPEPQPVVAKAAVAPEPAEAEVKPAPKPVAAPVPAATPMRRPPATRPAVAAIRQPPVVQTAASPPVGTLQKMKDEGVYRQQYFKEAQCFECNHKSKVGRSAKSASCPNCGAVIPLEDIELNAASSQSIKTRGDVLIRKRGELSATEVYAKDLRCQGTISADIHCSGDAIFRTTGTIAGQVHCRRFIVEKGSNLVLSNPVHADEVEIHAPITGSVFSNGSVLISASGAVNGDVTARSVSIEPGGELNGAMNIVRSSQSK